MQRAAFADERSIRENGVPEPGGIRERRVDMPVTVHRRRLHEFAGAVEIADQVRGDDDERGGITGFRAEFVSAAPQDKRGMIAETEDIPCRRFFPETRILSASVDIDGEILHDEQSEAVAEFMEAVGFEFPCTPDAEHLDFSIADERELPFEHRRVFVMETVGRHPVASFYKEFFPVDAESPVSDCVVAAVLRTGKINFFVFPA